ncbi:MAG: 1,4-beta-xylanase [Clostridia bacterium]|nr:1,4-beta-xylanase [Clostridia bacterium]
MTDTFLHAMTFAFCERRGFTEKENWKTSLRTMQEETGCNAVILPVVGWQEHAYSTEIPLDTDRILSPEDVQRVAELTRALGMKLILKTMVNCLDGYWRAYIRFIDPPVGCEPSFEEWFQSYTRLLLYTAGLAQENQADMLCVGCETVGTDGQEQLWRAAIREARKVYTGPMTYNCDKYQEGRVAWWDALDVISSSGYYPITDLSKEFARIQSVCRQWQKPFLFMECGCPSRQGSEHRPNDWKFGGATDVKAQSDWYAAFLQALQANPWVIGAGWWDWPARLYPDREGIVHNGYCMHGKPAAALMKAFAMRTESR